MTYKNVIFFLTIVCAATMQAAEGTKKENFFQKNFNTASGYVTSFYENNINPYKKIIKAVIAVVAIVPALFHITDGKKFNTNDSELEEIKVILDELKKSPSNKAHYKKLAKQLYMRVINLVRRVTGHRSYKITVKTETIESENKDGSKNVTTIKDEKKIEATKLCKVVEDAFENGQKLMDGAALVTFIMALSKFDSKGLEEIAKHGKLA